MNTKTFPTESERFHSLDFLRGFFVFLAIFQHYGHYLLNLIHEDISLFGYLLLLVFVPFVSQVYLFMAAFNLSRRGPQEARKGLLPKLKVFGSLFLLFTIESLLVEGTMEFQIYYNSIMNWMVILSLVYSLYAFFGVKGVGYGFLGTLALWTFPMDQISQDFETWMTSFLGIPFHYEERVHLFWGSGFLGLLLGYLYHQRPLFLKRWGIPLFVFAVLLILPHFIWGVNFNPEGPDTLTDEYLVASTHLGQLHIWGIEVAVMLIFLFLKFKGRDLSVPFFNWIGQHSLPLFFFHRIALVKLLLPLFLLSKTSIYPSLVPDNTVMMIVLLLQYMILMLIAFKLRLLDYLKG